MDLNGVRDSWNALAKENAVAAMLSSDLKGKITDVQDLFASGRAEVDELMFRLDSLGVTLKKNRMLDFGCGVGRLSQTFVEYFDEVYGIDIAPAVIDLANQYNRHPQKCKYVLNQTNNLQLLADSSIDLVWCYGALHLIEPRYVRDYIKEFLRVLVHDGIAVFNHVAGPATTLKGLLLRLAPTQLLNLHHTAKYGFEIHSISRKVMTAMIQAERGKLLYSKKDQYWGPNWLGYQYYVLKSPTRSKQRCSVE
jgi:ubiquinone/menaquinone biosynthesis C-methylase UbiE